VNQIKHLFFNDRDRLQFSLFFLGGVILFLYSAVLTFAPVIRTLDWETPINWEQWIGFLVWLVASFLVHKASTRHLPNRDPYIIPIVFILTGIGLMTIFRLSTSFGWRQLIWFSFGSIILFWGMKFPAVINQLRRYKYIWLTVGLLVTGLTFVFGIYPGGEGPRLWLGWGGIYFQPSEPLKLLFIIYLAAFFADNWALRKNLSVLLVSSFVMVVAAILILFAQRDLGTATIFLTIYMFYIFIVSGKKRSVFIFFMIIAIAGYFGYRNFSVIQIRIDGWLNPWVDPSGGSYQIIQSIQAIAAGFILGSGPGLGSPGIVPVAISDFIFAAISEELGLFGSLFIIGATTTFWTTERLEILNIFTYGGSEIMSYPMHIFPRAIRVIFTFVVPAIFLSYFPAVYILNKPDPLNAPSFVSFLAPVITSAIFLAAMNFWRFGIKNYQSTGS